MNVTVYTKPGCHECKATIRQMDRLEIPYTAIDVTKDHAAQQRLREQLSLSLPRVEVTAMPYNSSGPTVHETWNRYRPTKIEELHDKLETGEWT